MTQFCIFSCLYIFTNQSFRNIVNINQSFSLAIYHRCDGVSVVVYAQVFIPWATLVYA
jgi:hypothetical protein